MNPFAAGGGVTGRRYGFLPNYFEPLLLLIILFAKKIFRMNGAKTAKGIKVMLVFKRLELCRDMKIKL